MNLYIIVGSGLFLLLLLIFSFLKMMQMLDKTFPQQDDVDE